MSENNDKNVLSQARKCKLPINGIYFEFAYTRNDVASLMDDIQNKKAEIETARKWLLHGLKGQQKQQMVEILDDPANFTLESKIMIALLPFLGKNQTTIGELIVED